MECLRSPSAGLLRTLRTASRLLTSLPHSRGVSSLAGTAQLQAPALKASAAGMTKVL